MPEFRVHIMTAFLLLSGYLLVYLPTMDGTEDNDAVHGGELTGRHRMVKNISARRNGGLAVPGFILLDL